MTVPLTLALALSCAAGAAPVAVLLFVEKRRHRATRARLSLIDCAGEADRTARLRAELRLDTIHDQHVRAGRAAHRADEQAALRAATVERLRHVAPNPPRPRAEVEAEVAARRAARKAANAPLDAEEGSSPANSPAGEVSASPAFVPSQRFGSAAPCSSAEKKGARHG